MSDALIAAVVEISHRQRLLATEKEQIARVVMASFEDHITLQDIAPRIKKKKGGCLVYEFTGLVDRGEHYEDVTFTMTVTRYPNGKISAEAEDDTDLCGGMPQHFGPGPVEDVLEQIGFEHLGDHGQILWMG